MNTVIAGDLVYVKASANYNETATIDIVGTNSNPITFEGYTTTPGDAGQATIHGQSARASGILDSIAAARCHYVFKNFRITGHTSSGVITDQRHLHWKNCKFDTNGTAGIQCQSGTFEACEFSDNSGSGLFATTAGPIVCVGCKFYRNGGAGSDTAGLITLLVGCEFFSNSTTAIDAGGANDTLLALVNCVIDGDAKDTTVGVSTNVSFSPFLTVVNSIIYDCVTGIASNLLGGNKISRNNLVNSNTTDYTNYSTLTGEVTTAPSFVDESTQDYTLNAASPAKNTGYDIGAVGMDIGSRQLVDSGGSGLTGAKQTMTGGQM
jgi:hypothetical protein